MAGSGFPARKSMGAGGMTAQGVGASGPLDAPPPSPVDAGLPSPALTPGVQPPMPSFDQMAPPLTAGSPGRAVAPEVLQGVMQGAETIFGMLDSFASIVPDLANDFALQKDLLQRTMAKLVVSGGQQAGAGALGLNYPGGGFLSGAA